jgi:hypothetical protein
MTYPLDLVRTRMAGVYESDYRTMRGTLSRIFREEGLRGFYRGIGPTLFGSFPYEGIKFATIGYMRENIPDFCQHDPTMKVMWSLLAGSSGATLSHLILYPNETLRRRMQMKNAPYRNSLHCISSVVRKEGVMSLYRGLQLAIIRGVPNTGIQMGCYEALKISLELNPPAES